MQKNLFGCAKNLNFTANRDNMNNFNIFNLNNQTDFNNIALEIFNFQAINNLVYRDFIHLLGIEIKSIKKIEQIPFLPVSFFKNKKIIANKEKIQQIFYSSGTTSTQKSKHYVTDLELYKKSFSLGFKHFYGNIGDYVVLALLPNYLEQKNSSLVYMVNELINKTNNKESGFYLNNLDELVEKLLFLNNKNKKILLIGVSFALLDLIEKPQFFQKLNNKNIIIMETGGMKGKRKEIIRKSLHKKLKRGFGVTKIHSEYGMTELLSQAYSINNGIFKTPPWMQILISDTEDALSILPYKKAGTINIIDLANYNSCSFIATQDLGRLTKHDSFEVLGRFDNSDIRGCNLMIE